MSHSRFDVCTSAGFHASTLVRTELGLRRISDLQIGDLVVSRSPSSDENIIQPVSKIARISEAPIVLVNFSCQSANGAQSESLVVAGLPRLFVSGIDPDYPAEYMNAIGYRTGWHEIREVTSMLRVKSLTDPHVYMWPARQIWNSKTATTGWIELARDSDFGYRIELNDEHIIEGKDKVLIKEITDGIDYLERHDSDEIADHLAMRAPVYAIEIADNLPFFVGTNGIFVHAGSVTNAFTVWAHERIWED